MPLPWRHFTLFHWPNAFRAMRTRNYRVWAMGALVSNTGTWMQRTAQDWLVLAQLTRHDASALGFVMALQFAPQLLLFPLTGLAADRFDRRRFLIVTQSAMGALSLGLGLLTVAGVVRLWEVDAFAFLFGCATAFDGPARQTIVSNLVGDAQLANAVALNSTSFNAARMIGPAVAGLCIGTVGTGVAFLINGVSFAATILSLVMLRPREFHNAERAVRRRGGVREGFRYVAGRDDLRAVMLMLLVVGTFGMNFPIYISTMSVGVFHAGARVYGLLASTMAVGTVTGALLAANRETPRFEVLTAGAGIFGVMTAVAAVMPDAVLFGVALVGVGIAALTFVNTTNSLVQLATEPAMRGRVMALRLTVALGGTPVGAPVVGWVADRFGPRFALGVGAASGLVAALIGLRHMARAARLASVRQENET